MSPFQTRKQLSIVLFTGTALLTLSLHASSLSKKSRLRTFAPTPSLATQKPKTIEFSEALLEQGLEKGLHWLIEAQHQDGSWGAGSHSNQKNRDPTTLALTLHSFTALALI